MSSVSPSRCVACLVVTTSLVVTEQELMGQTFWIHVYKA